MPCFLRWLAALYETKLGVHVHCREGSMDVRVKRIVGGAGSDADAESFPS